MDTVFKESRKLFDNYTDFMHERWDRQRWEPEYGVEVAERLEQMDFIVWRLKELSRPTWASDVWAKQQYQQAWRGAGKLEFTDDPLYTLLRQTGPLSINDVEIRVLTEAFYFIADRARIVVKKLPLLRSFDAPGVRTVRNHLLQHPEGADSGVIENGFSFGLEQGPVVKGVRRANKVAVFPDSGLYVNANEFAVALERKVVSVLEALHKQDA